MQINLHLDKVKSFALILSTLMLCACQSTQKQYTGNRYVRTSEIETTARVCDAKAPSRSWAVVTGINFYQDERIPDLEGAVDDAWNFYHYLVSEQGARFEPTQVKLLLNEEATRSGLEDALGQFLTAACPQDQVVIYFAGHGAPEPSRPEEAFLLVHDTSLDSMVSSAVSMSQLPKFLQWRTGSTAQLLMLIDACHSGNIQFPNSRGVSLEGLDDPSLGEQVNQRAQSVNTTLTKMVKSQAGWGAISAAGADQKAGESGGFCQLSGKEYSGGLFTCALLESLDGRADQDQNSKLSFDELYGHLSRRVVEMRGLEQIPQRSGSMAGQNIILPTINQKLELPRVPMRYLREIHPKPYRNWLYGSIALTGVALAGSLTMNLITNQSAQEANRYTASAAIEPAGPAGYALLNEQYESDRATAMQLYVSTAILGAITSSLFALDLFHQPEGASEVYRRDPGLVLERSVK